MVLENNQEKEKNKRSKLQETKVRRTRKKVKRGKRKEPKQEKGRQAGPRKPRGENINIILKCNIKNRLSQKFPPFLISDFFLRSAVLGSSQSRISAPTLAIYRRWSCSSCSRALSIYPTPCFVLCKPRPVLLHWQMGNVISLWPLLDVGQALRVQVDLWIM